MLYTHFEVKNFKGIIHAKLDINSQPHSKIHCLVGLNESGKTTVLEAINYFSYNSDKLTALDLKGYKIEDPSSLIPISQRANYSGNTVIAVGLKLSDLDEQKIKREIKSETGFELSQPISSIKIEHIIKYKDSKFDGTNLLWTLVLRGKDSSARGKTYELTTKKNKDLWLKVINIITKHIPGILFFPNFLFDFPSRTYLEDNNDADAEKHRFYRNVVQDILDCLGNKTNVQTHIVARAKSIDASDKVSLNQLLLAAARHVSQNIFSQWGNIAKTRNSKRKIVITHGINGEGKVYLEFNIEDTDGLFLITERSLGFRWFFVFFLLTYYRAHRAKASGNALFLFDEPASNLHQSAQAHLLNIFEKIGASSQVIYTTHSHHLINPKWLDSTHIVRNEGLHELAELDDFVSTNTRIAIHKYRKFSVEHPDQTAYFQPILDVLDYRPSQLELTPSVVMLEGKSDYYVMRYFQDVLSTKPPINFLPGTGSGSLTTVIQLYLSWGKKFLVLLDDDKEGKKQKERYLELFGVALTPYIYSFGDIDPVFEDKEIEQLLTEGDRLAIQKYAYQTDTSINKTHFQRAVQEALINNYTLPLSEESRSNLEKAVEFCREKFSLMD